MFWFKKKKKEVVDTEALKKVFMDDTFEFYKLNKKLEGIHSVMNEKYFTDQFNSCKLEENKDYEVVENGYKKITIFYNKLSQPFRYEKKDLAKYYLVREINEQAIIIKKIRQQRTQGNLEGRSSMHLESRGGGLFGGSYVSADGGGHINGVLDTLDEFILVVNFNNVNAELRVSANLYYMVEEGDKLFATYNDRYYDYSNSYNKVPYKYEEIVKAESNCFTLKDLETKREVAQEKWERDMKILPREIVDKVLDEVNLRLGYGPRW